MKVYVLRYLSSSFQMKLDVIAVPVGWNVPAFEQVYLSLSYQFVYQCLW